ncbi:MAG: low specificity L-threonine aldolase [Deltaproteobacteria bacterium]|nr:low specificity L-threonine aldolase [Deltaproteobacteria bacterium]
MEPFKKRGFASDNNAGVHPRIMEAIAQANQGHVVAYGDDPYTEAAIRKFKETFGEETEVFFVYNGTGANVLSLQSLTHSFQAIICAETAHINEDECGAPEKFTGCKLLTISTKNGKITIEQIRPHLHALGNEHHAQPKVISITQATELGTVYLPDEITAITRFAHQNGLFVHLDGARICNAAVALNVGLREATRDLGVDVLSFGGTKNGVMFGEAVIFFNPDLARDFKFIRKQGTQLASKMRFIAVQFEALLTDHLWRRNAEHANTMATLLAREVRDITQVEIVQSVDANAIFAKIPQEQIQLLQQEYFFYVWDEEQSIVRWMTSFDTTEEDIMGFVSLLKKVLG